MTLQLYSIKDKLNGFACPIPFTNENLAKRWYKENQIENLTIRNSIEDFSLYYMGEFDTETGEIKSEIKMIMEGRYGDDRRYGKE